MRKTSRACSRTASSSLSSTVSVRAITGASLAITASATLLPSIYEDHFIPFLARISLSVEPDKDRLSVKTDSPRLLDASLDFIFQRENLVCGCPSAVHDSESVLA